MVYSYFPSSNQFIGAQQPFEYSTAMMGPSVQSFPAVQMAGVQSFAPNYQFIQGEVPQQVVYGTVQQPIVDYKSGGCE